VEGIVCFLVFLDKVLFFVLFQGGLFVEIVLLLLVVFVLTFLFFG